MPDVNLGIGATLARGDELAIMRHRQAGHLGIMASVEGLGLLLAVAPKDDSERCRMVHESRPILMACVEEVVSSEGPAVTVDPLKAQMDVRRRGCQAGQILWRLKGQFPRPTVDADAVIEELLVHIRCCFSLVQSSACQERGRGRGQISSSRRAMVVVLLEHGVSPLEDAPVIATRGDEVVVQGSPPHIGHMRAVPCELEGVRPFGDAGVSEQFHLAKVVASGEEDLRMTSRHGVHVGPIRARWPDALDWPSKGARP
mmetsp:Transcript_26861/g.78202  ORF Transcript_26861/g.78202 Transcript_26861/m.78202 type:complete len:257 (+) Transcript_26861:608-1378(+)